MPVNRRSVEIAVLLHHITALDQEDELRARDERVVKITHAVRKSQELSPFEKERVRSLLAEREWERLKGFLFCDRKRKDEEFFQSEKTPRAVTYDEIRVKTSVLMLPNFPSRVT